MNTKIENNQFQMEPFSAPKKPQNITIEFHNNNTLSFIDGFWGWHYWVFSYKLQLTIYMKYVFHWDFGCLKHRSKYIRLHWNGWDRTQYTMHATFPNQAQIKRCSSFVLCCLWCKYISFQIIETGYSIIMVELIRLMICSYKHKI